MSRFAIVLALFAVGSPILADEENPKEVRGSIEDETLAKAAPASGFIASGKDLETLSKAWNIKPPKVDFNKELILIGTTRGSRINGRPTLTDGDLKIAFISTRDLRPGFRYLMIVHPREGVKSVNGKELRVD